MKNNISNKILKEFGFLIGLVLPIIFGWILPVFRGHSFQIWTLWISSTSIILALLKPSLLFYPYKAWMKMGYILGWFNSRIILGIVFIIVLLPIALIMRIFSHDPLNLKKVNKSSFREIKENHKINLRKIF
tara:strand:- start:503 stop:895 length:393 start_codon:yes stop_codon:yes gene_type:complete